MDIELIATAVVTILAPFTPFLVEAGKEGGKKLAEAIGEKGGEAAWNKAQELWKKIKTHLGNDPKVKGAALLVSADPKDEDSQKMFVAALIAKLKEKPNLTQELSDLLGGQKAIQQVLVNRKSWAKDITQQISGSGEQTIKVDNNSRIQGVTQINKK